MTVEWQEWKHDGFTISCDPRMLDVSIIHEFLAGSYWARNIPKETVARSLDGSLNFSLLLGARQIGFARAVTDYATFAWLGDVFVLPAYRGRGLGKWLMSCVLAHPRLQGMRRWMLATQDAHGLYQSCGFTPLKSSQLFMERHDPDVYGIDTESRTSESRDKL